MQEEEITRNNKVFKWFDNYTYNNERKTHILFYIYIYNFIFYMVIDYIIYIILYFLSSKKLRYNDQNTPNSKISP